MKTESKNLAVGRRSFLQHLLFASVAVAGSSVVTACGDDDDDSPTPDPHEIDWDEETDVVIVGAGGAGFTAAIEARKAGAGVIILEKAATVGGTTAVSGGVFQATGTEYTDSSNNIEKHYQYWLAAGEDVPDPQLVRLMADNAPAAYQFMTEQGFTYSGVYGVDPIPYIDESLMLPRIHIGVGAGAGHAEALHLAAQAAGADIRTESPVKALIYAEDKGVLGVRARIGETDRYIRAKRAVILACGGFDHNEALSRQLSPQQLWEKQTGRCLCAPTNTGDGLEMGMALGADLATVGGTIGYPALAIGVNGNPPVPGIWVNRYGQRFVNEASHYAYAMRAVFDQEQHNAWAIFDETVKQLGGAAIGGWASGWSEDLSTEIANGTIKTGETIEALATAAGINPTQLQRTIEQWNTDVGTGTDTLFDKQVGLQALETGPYYAAKVTSANLGSIGGLKINAKTQVINTFGEIIPRLYAAGMVAGGFIGPYYPGSGTALCATVVFGRIAGINAAAETAQN